MSKLTWGVIIGGVVIVVSIILLATDPFHVNSGSGSGGSSDTLSAEASAYLSAAMPMLEKTLSDFQAGNVAQAASDWEGIGDMPINNSADDFVSGDYLTYANNVRYYMLGDGSATLRDVEESQVQAEAAISAFQ